MATLNLTVKIANPMTKITVKISMKITVKTIMKTSMKTTVKSTVKARGTRRMRTTGNQGRRRLVCGCLMPE